MSSTLCLAEMRVVDSPVLTSEFAMRVDSQPNGGNFDLIHDLGPANGREVEDTRYHVRHYHMHSNLT